MTWTHEFAVTLAASPTRVFAALTHASELQQWFAEHADVEASAGGRYRFWGRRTPGCPGESDATQTIIRFDPDRVLGFTWTLHGISTEVQLTLAAEKESTRLTLHHTVHGELPMPRPKEFVEDSWRLAFGNLAAHLGGGEGLLLPDYADPAPEVRLTILVEAPRELVFRALIEAEMVNRWFGTSSAFVEPRQGGRYELNWTYQVNGVDVVGGPTKIRELVPNERLVLDWTDWRGDMTVTGQTISFSLESVGDVTRVTFVHAGFGRTADIGDYGFGWPSFLGDLAKVFATPG